ncbi:MAG: hypothetical protein ACRYFZ_09560 [Janthinobacterium lividum]
MTELEKLLGVVAPILNKSADEIAEVLKSDEGTAALTQSFKDYRKSQYDDGHKAAGKSIKGQVEAALRKRGAADASFDELDTALDTLETAAREKSGKTLTAEELLKQKPVIDALNAKDRERETAVAQATTTAQEAVKADRDAFRKEQADTKVEAAARKLIAELNPNLPTTDPAKQTNLINRLVAEIKQGKYEVDEAGAVRPLGEDGTYEKNGHGHPVEFAEKVRGVVTSLYDLPVANPREIPQAGNPAGNPGQFEFKHYKGAVPKTAEEITALRSDQTIPLDARKELKAYGEAQGF